MAMKRALQLNSTDKILLSMYFDKGGSAKYIAECSELSVSQTRRLLKGLESAGCVTSDETRHYGTRGGRPVKEYELTDTGKGIALLLTLDADEIAATYNFFKETKHVSPE